MAAAVLRYWKESAALIIVRRLHPTQCHTERVVSSPKTPTAASTEAPRPECNYQLFMAERTAKISSFPKAHVFPGGSAEETDFSAQWLDVFRPCKEGQTQEETPESQLLDFFANNSSRTPMYSRQRKPEFSAIASEVAFRITAIREVFEEIGVLFARKVEENPKDEENEGKCSIHYHDINKQQEQRRRQQIGRRCKANIYDLPLEVSEFWRRRVVENSEDFCLMCKELKLVPDITALSEWNNWLTPNHRSGKRFDSIFYITFLDEQQQPVLTLDPAEYVGYKWLSPMMFLSETKSKKIHLIPPQYWELTHLNYSSWEELYNLVSSHPYTPPNRFLSVKATCKDGTLLLLPGDHMYPENLNLEKYDEFSLPFTKNEIHSTGKFLNHFDVEERKVYRTVPFSPPRAKKHFTSHL